MSAAQDKGKKRLRPNSNGKHPLVGMYMHTFHDTTGYLQYQGEILGVDGDVVLVRIFEWMMGEAREVKKFTKSYIYSDKCALYGEREVWLFEAEAIQKREFKRRMPAEMPVGGVA